MINPQGILEGILILAALAIIFFVMNALIEKIMEKISGGKSDGPYHRL